MTNDELTISVVAKATGVSKAKILSPSRRWIYVEARMLLILLLSSEGATDERIGWVIGRSRPTVTKSRHTAHGLTLYSASFRDKYNKIKSDYHEQKSLRLSQA